MNRFEEAAVQTIIANKNTQLDKCLAVLNKTIVENTILRKSNAELQEENAELLKELTDRGKEAKRLLNEITARGKENNKLLQENETLNVLVTRAETALEIMALRFASHQIGYIAPDIVDSLAASAYAEAVRQESKK